MNFGGDHPAPGHGKISPRCVPKLPAVARYRPDAFPGCRPWQDCGLMRSRRGLGREKHRFVATYRLHVFRFSLFWQDMHAMHPKSPAERRWGMHRANILPPSDGPAPAQGLLPEQLHRGTALQRLVPCPGCLPPSASPIPATCQYPPLAGPVAARGKPPMDFGGDRSAHGI